MTHLRWLVAIAFVAQTVLVPTGHAQPPVGDWTIADEQTIANQDVSVRGNIVIKAGGKLIMRNSTLTMDTPPPQEGFILIEQGGTLQLLGTKETPSTLEDTSLDIDDPSDPEAVADYHFEIRVLRGGHLYGEHCQIQGAGVHTSRDPGFADDEFAGRAGITVAGKVSLHFCTLENRNGIHVDAGTLTLSHVSTNPTDLVDVTAHGGMVRISNSTIRSIVQIGGSTGVTIDNSTLESGHEVGRHTIGLESDSPGAPQAVIRNSRFSGFLALMVSNQAQATMDNVTFASCQRALRVNVNATVTARHVSFLKCPDGFLVSSGHLTLENLTSDEGSRRGAVLPEASGVLRNTSLDEEQVQTSKGSHVVAEGYLGILVSGSGNRMVRLEMEAGSGGFRADVRGAGPHWIPLSAALFNGSDWAAPSEWKVSARAGGKATMATIPTTWGSATVTLDLGTGMAGFEMTMVLVSVLVTLAWSRRRRHRPNAS